MLTKNELLLNWQQNNLDERLLYAFDQIPRENFVPPKYKEIAYEDRPLPTIRNQSISQPTTIMVMLQALDLKDGENVFEIGAGVGYQAALISKVIGEQGKLTSVEVVPELVHIARKHMDDLGLVNVNILEADGSSGYSERSPYDKIIITAACPTIPQPVIDQLREGGIVVAPVGDLESQTMVKGVKVDGKLELEFLGPFRFVPMKGKYGFSELELEQMGK